MADPSPNTNSTIISDSTKEEGQVTVVREQPILRPRRLYKNLPKIEEVDSKYKDEILTLPKEERCAGSMLRKYKGFWMLEEWLPGVLAMEEAFEPRPSDVIVASSVKSGTTWLKALVFTIVHRDKYALSSHHPLLKLNPHDCVPFIDYYYASRDEQYLETLPSPRVLGTHVPYSILPECIKASKCPVVYICREPKDVLVSDWHMVNKIEWLQKSFPFDQAFELFCEGQVPNGPIWDHVLEYYMESMHRTDKILFLKYEEMMKDPIDGVMRIANFVGCPFSEEEVKAGVVKEIVEFCSFNKLKDHDVNNKSGLTNHLFFRKAVVGDWQNHMTTEMAAKLDDITKEKLHRSGFTFGVTASSPNRVI